MDPGRDKRRGQDVAGQPAEIDRRLQPYCRTGRLRSALAQPFDEMLLLKLADPLDQFDRAHLRESNLPLLAFDARDLSGEFGPLARDIFQLGRRFLAGRRPKAVELLLERLQLLIQLKFERARFGQDLLQTRAKGRQLVFRREHGAAERVARCTQRLVPARDRRAIRRQRLCARRRRRGRRDEEHQEQQCSPERTHPFTCRMACRAMQSAAIAGHCSARGSDYLMPRQEDRI